MVTIQSNVIRDEYKDTIIAKTLNEIYEAIKCVYGPYGNDVFIKKNGQTYYTRDGKEVIGTIRFDNLLSRDILSVMYQAIEKQARTAGDGTTTLILLYINIYRGIMSRLEKLKSFPSSDIRREYEELVKIIVDKIKTERTTKLNDEDFKSMLFTCTQDPELSMKIYNSLYSDFQESPYIIVSKSDFKEDFVIERNERPIIKCDKIFSYSACKDVFTSNNARILYVDGAIDIGYKETLRAMLESNMGIPNADIIILCNGITESTRKSIQEIRSDAELDNRTDLNNIIFMRMDNSLLIEKVVKEDLSSFVYNIDELTGITNTITFEAYMFKTLVSNVDSFVEYYKSNNMEIPSIIKYDASQANIDRMIYALGNVRSVEYSIGDGLKINSELTEVSKMRYAELKKQIADEKSEVKRLAIINRLRNIFGVFVEVKVGSELLKDSQRKFELILDAVLSSQEGFEHGVLRNNSLLETINVIKSLTFSDGDVKKELADILMMAVINTIIELIDNKCNLTLSAKSDMIAMFLSKNIDKLNLRTKTLDASAPEEMLLKIDDDNTINTNVVEPVSIIENLLINSPISLDLALSKIFTVDGFMQNYI